MSRRSIPVIDAAAPPERLAAFRILVGVFVMGYLVIRIPVYLGLDDRPPEAFDGVGVLGFADRPLPAAVIGAVLIVTLVTGVAFTLGTWFRLTAPVFAVGLLVLGTLRSSFGQLLHFENLFVLHVLVLALAPAADAWALRQAAPAAGEHQRARPSTRYGFPLALASVITVTTYVVAGLAKVRTGDLAWVTEGTLRNHVAYTATRLEVLGGDAPVLAETAVRYGWIFMPMAAAVLVLELGAPLALLGRPFRWAWTAGIWVMHLGILAFMHIAFPYPLLGVAFAPFFHLEVLRHPIATVRAGRRRVERRALDQSLR